MAKTDFQSADEYVATFPDAIQEVLRTVRAAILAGVPQPEEVISYQIPAVKSDGWVFYYAAFKDHFSLSCPPPFTVFDQFAEELAPYQRSMSAIRFPLDQPVPVALITAMTRFRVEQNAAAAAAKPAKAPRSRPPK